MSYVQSTIDQAIVLEGQVEAQAEAVAVSTLAELHPRIAAFIEQLRITNREQRAALETQRERVGRAGDGNLRLALSLSGLYASLNEAMCAYAVLHAVAHRAFDSQAEGNTADLAEAHLRSYAARIQQLDMLISDVVITELSGAGADCRCQCPPVASACACARLMARTQCDRPPTTLSHLHPMGGCASASHAQAVKPSE
jgi:hypothetical protein